MHIVNSILSSFMISETNESESLALSRVHISHDNSAHDITIDAEHFKELSIINVIIEILDKDIGELDILTVAKVSDLSGDEWTDVNFLVNDEHAIDTANGLVSSSLSFEVNETETLGVSVFISVDLARQNVTKSTEGVIESLVVNRLVQVLDENVSNTRLTESGISLRPHNTARLSSDGSKVQGLQSTFSILRILEVDVGITQRATGRVITANTDGSDKTNGIEVFIKDSFGNVREQITNVKGRVMERKIHS